MGRDKDLIAVKELRAILECKDKDDKEKGGTLYPGTSGTYPKTYLYPGTVRCVSAVEQESAPEDRISPGAPSPQGSIPDRWVAALFRRHG